MLAITKTNVARLDCIRQSGRDPSEARRGMKILLVDDHFLIREALRRVIKDLKEEATILEARNCSQAMQLIAEHKDIAFLFLELSLPDRDGLSVLGLLREHYPGMSVVVLSARHDRYSVAKALSLGAIAFIPKSQEREVLRSALGLVFAGGVYIPPDILTGGGEALASTPKPTCGARNSNSNSMRPADFRISKRQLDVLQLMMQGKANKVICRELNLAIPTIKNHTTAIFKALKVTNRTEAVIAVRKLGWDWPFVRSKSSIENIAPSSSERESAHSRGLKDAS
jgi:DNA-binding NarL/FixJ family response regulator